LAVTNKAAESVEGHGYETLTAPQNSGMGRTNSEVTFVPMFSTL